MKRALKTSFIFLLMLVFALIIPLFCTAEGNYGADTSSADYKSNVNPFYKHGYKGQCTWYSWGRALERSGVALSWGDGEHLGDAGYWYACAAEEGYSTGTVPKANSIAVWPITGSMKNGHVAYVEGVSGDTIYISEYNFNIPGGYTESTINVSSGMRQDTFPNLRDAYVSAKPTGYIYLDDIPPEFTSADIEITDISIKGFTVTYHVEDNVGVTSVYVRVAPSDEINRVMRFPGTYDPETKTATVNVSLERLGYINNTYVLLCYAEDKIGNKTYHRPNEWLSPYEINKEAAGQYVAIRDTSMLIAPAKSFNGYDTAGAKIEKNSKWNVLGSHEEEGILYYRLSSGSYGAGIWVLAEDMKYVTKLDDSSIMPWIKDYLERNIYGFFVLDGTVHPIVKKDDKLILSGKVYKISAMSLRELYINNQIADDYIASDSLDYAVRIEQNDDQETATIVGYTGTETNVVIPEEIGGFPVTKIGAYAFEGNETMTSLTIPAGIKRIEQSAFAGCKGLQVVNLPSTIYYGYNNNTIESNAFSNCPAIREITMPADWLNSRHVFPDSSNIETIHYIVGSTGGVMCDFGSGQTAEHGYGTQYYTIEFLSAGSLKSVDFAEGITYIGDFLFNNTNGILTSVKLPASLKSIGDYAFTGQKNLTQIDLPAGLVSLGYNCFAGTGLTSVKLPTGLTEIPEYCFQACHSLESVSIPKSVVAIGIGAFCECDNLLALNLPKEGDNLTIKASAFQYCSKITTLAIPERVIAIHRLAFADCKGLQVVNLPSTIYYGYSYNTIESDAFSNCPAIREITMPADWLNSRHVFPDSSNIETIHYIVGSTGGVMCDFEPGQTAEHSGGTQYYTIEFLSAGSLKSVDFAEGITHIGNCLFNNTNGVLTSVKLPASLKSIGDYAFTGQKKLTKLQFEKNIAIERISETSFADLNETLTFYGYHGSYIEQYAITNNFRFVPLDGMELPIDAEHFPDPAFRTDLLTDYYDKDGSGGFSEDELKAVTRYIHDEEWDEKLTSLVGIEYFPNLEHLTCPYNEITKVDLSKNTKLKDICLAYNKLKALDVSACSNLEHLECFSNEIRTLDLSNCPKLAEALANNERKHCDIEGSVSQTSYDYVPGLLVDPFTVITAGDIISGDQPGDVNGDNKADGRDAIHLMKYLAGEIDEETGEPIQIDLKKADLNGDGEVNELDLLWLMKLLAGEMK